MRKKMKISNLLVVEKQSAATATPLTICYLYWDFSVKKLFVFFSTVTIFPFRPLLDKKEKKLRLYLNSDYSHYIK